MMHSLVSSVVVLLSPERLVLLTRHQAKLGAAVVVSIVAVAVLVWIAVRLLRPRDPAVAERSRPPFDLPEASEAPEARRPVDPGVANVLGKAAAHPDDERTTADLVDDALRVVTALGGVSVPAIQRKLLIDYERATELVHKLEAEGYVSEAGSGGKRRVLPQAYAYVETLGASSADTD